MLQFAEQCVLQHGMETQSMKKRGSRGDNLEILTFLNS